MVKRSRISQFDPRILFLEFWKTPSHDLDPINLEKIGNILQRLSININRLEARINIRENEEGSVFPLALGNLRELRGNTLALAFN